MYYSTALYNTRDNTLFMTEGPMWLQWAIFGTALHAEVFAFRTVCPNRTGAVCDTEHLNNLYQFLIVASYLSLISSSYDFGLNARGFF